MKAGFALCAVLGGAFLLGGCGEEMVEIKYGLDEPVAVEVFTQSHYSTYMGEDEHMGTITASYYSLLYTNPAPGKYVLERRFVSDASRGYLKNSHPAELLWRVPYMRLEAEDIRVKSVQGYETFADSVVAKLNIPATWKKQLSNPAYPKDLDRNEKHRWEMGHLLTGPVPSKGNITNLLRSRGRLEFALIQIDSVVTDGFSNLDKRRCLVYSVFLQEREPFPYYIWEQHVAGVPGAEKYKTYAPGRASYHTEYWMAIDPETGIPCQEREIKQGLHGMKHPDSGDSLTFRSQTSQERLFTVKK